MLEGIFDHNALASGTVYLVSNVVRVAGQSSSTKAIPLEHIESADGASVSGVQGSIFVPFFLSDDELRDSVSLIEKSGGRFFPPIFDTLVGCWEPYDIGRSRFLWTDLNALHAITVGVDSGAIQGFGYLHAHEALCQALAATRNIPGSIVEIGVLQGHSAMTMLRYMRLAKINRVVYLFDTFDGFSYPTAFTSADGQWAGTLKVWETSEAAVGHIREELLPLVGEGSKLVMQRLNVLSDELPPEVSPIAVANVDVDLFEATQVALEKVAPFVAVGGIIHCDDPSATPMTAGALLGMERFLDSALGRSFMKLMLGSQYVLVRVGT